MFQGLALLRAMRYQTLLKEKKEKRAGYHPKKKKENFETQTKLPAFSKLKCFLPFPVSVLPAEGL